MMPDWEFEELPASLVEQELTQRDQFNNDDVGLVEALVREVIQNSSDAARNGAPVKVRFEFKTLEQDAAGKLRELFGKLRPHLAACGIDDAPFEQGYTRVLVIEDFNTKGLTGSYDTLDEDNFRNFWRRHGKSGKGGKSGGRWGLGKLVFSSSSQVRAFFGLTLREGDQGALLMGQAVLSNHMLDGRRYPAHGFWFEGRATDGSTLQLPLTDPAKVGEFRSLVGFVRTDQPGLSIAIPYISARVREADVVNSVVNNYYFPILAGRLVVEVGSQIISKQTFHRVATAAQSSSDDRVPFTFVEEVSGRLEKAPDFVAGKALGTGGLDETFFSSEQREAMKQRFAEGGLIHVRIPVRLRPRNGTDIEKPIDLFLKPLPENGKSFALFARGPITLIGERRYFLGSPAHAALVASDEEIAAFLGDAENPAHTGWNSNAEKLAVSWRSPATTLGYIRHSLKHLYDLVAERIETKHPDALIDFFSLADQSKSPQSKKKKKPKVIPPVPPREKAIVIRPRKGGFEIVAGPGAAKWKYPRKIRVRMAYDIIGGNPFKRHSKFDFDLAKNEINLSAVNAEIEPPTQNTLTLKAATSEFRLEANGFDERRDIVVDARALP